MLSCKCITILLCLTLSTLGAQAGWTHIQPPRGSGILQAQKPPQGFNTWNSFGTNIDEQLIKRTADLMVELGLVQAGYTYLNIDDAWSDRLRDPQSGELQAHPTRFPSGIPHLVAYAKERGMQLGIYTDAGLFTCAGYPGSLGHEEQDAATFLRWGIEYVKVDNCWADPASVVQRYTAMGDGLRAAADKQPGAAPILYSLCSWGVGAPWRGWGRQVGGSTWRIDGDITADWRDILRCADSAIGLSRFAGPGGWNDPDMLEVGNGALSLGNERAHFALWCILKAPLLIGANLSSLAEPQRQGSLQVLLSEELIGINQDELGVAGDLVWAEGLLQVWAAPLSDGARAVVVVNRQQVLEPHPPELTLSWRMLGWDNQVQVTVRDLYARSDVAQNVQGSYTVTVQSGDCAALKLTPATSPARDDGWRPWHTPRTVGMLTSREQLTGQKSSTARAMLRGGVAQA